MFGIGIGIGANNNTNPIQPISTEGVRLPYNANVVPQPQMQLDGQSLLIFFIWTSNIGDVILVVNH